MNIENNKASNIKIAYIGGGSRGWAWTLMSDLACEKDISGTVVLYDIDKKAMGANEVIGNKIHLQHPELSKWEYKTANSLKEALSGVDFVVISILPGTFDEMEVDVDLPKDYGIYQPVGDSIGPGGLIRSLRTIPMFKEIALAIKEHSPNAYVINYTNPMTVSIKTLYTVFPKIKAVGCCHEVFGTQNLMAHILQKEEGIEATKEDINIEVCGVNHFTWITKAYYKNMDLMPMYKKFVDKHLNDGYYDGKDDNWFNNFFESANIIKFELFDKFNNAAAAGDRHLVEFCPRYWFLKSPKQVKDYKFSLTEIDWRKKNLTEKIEKSKKLVSGDETFELAKSSEAGVTMIKALCGLSMYKTNVNMINYGQFPQAPLGLVVETNALFSGIGIEPIVSKEKVSDGAYALIERAIRLQDMTVKAGLRYDLDLAYQVFILDGLTTIDFKQSRKLFDEMISKTSKYLPKQYFEKGTNYEQDKWR